MLNVETIYQAMDRAYVHDNATGLARKNIPACLIRDAMLSHLPIQTIVKALEFQEQQEGISWDAPLDELATTFQSGARYRIHKFLQETDPLSVYNSERFILEAIQN